MNCFFFFFQAEDGIRDLYVTGVQTCALPISAKLEPGRYAVRIRAVGYDIDGPGAVEVAARKTATLDLKLKKTSDLAAQLSNGEMMASVPGTDQQKGLLLNCVGCHTLE